jgi:beta-lactamase regulating signal transducer with metallopeptidase domain
MTTHDLADAAAWALIHFIWQGTAIALAAAAVGLALRRARPQTRYAFYGAALTLMMLVPVVTFAARLMPREATVLAPLQASAAVPSISGATVAQASEPPADRLRWIVAIWLAGVALTSARWAGGWTVAQRLTRRKTFLLDGSCRQAAERLAARLGIPRAVTLLGSYVTDVPLTIGWLRPVILLPASTLTALTPGEIEMILAHELAHIRRHDYVVNLLQAAVESLLFYHPAVWWVSGRIRVEREHRCDDLAVEACGNAVDYARALAALDAIVSVRPRAALAATGAPLLARIERLLDRGRTPASAAPAWLGTLAAVAIVLAAVCAARPQDVLAEERVAPAPPADGFLSGLAAAGYTDISVDEIIDLREHGVDPRTIQAMLQAGLGRLTVPELIRLQEHGVRPEFVSSAVASGLVSDLDVDTSVRLSEHGVDPADLAGIHALGFGPFTTADVIRLREHGADASAFEVLKAIGLDRGSVDDAIVVRDNGLTTERIREMRRQGFEHLNLDQIVKLARGGVI